MISADEARSITDDIIFERSGVVAMMDTAIKQEAAKGNNNAEVIVPISHSIKCVETLEKHGFRVVVKPISVLGMKIIAAW